MDAKTDPFDPAANGWETYADEGFIGHVGPFWMRKDGSYRYAFLAQKKHHNRRGVVQGGMIMTFQQQAAAGNRSSRRALRRRGADRRIRRGEVPRRAPHPLAHFHERRDHGRRPRGRDRERRVEGAGQGLSAGLRGGVRSRIRTGLCIKIPC